MKFKSGKHFYKNPELPQLRVKNFSTPCCLRFEILYCKTKLKTEEYRKGFSRKGGKIEGIGKRCFLQRIGNLTPSASPMTVLSGLNAFAVSPARVGLPLHLASSPAYASSPADKRDYHCTCKARFQARG